MPKLYVQDVINEYQNANTDHAMTILSLRPSKTTPTKDSRKKSATEDKRKNSATKDKRKNR